LAGGQPLQSNLECENSGRRHFHFKSSDATQLARRLGFNRKDLAGFFSNRIGGKHWILITRRTSAAGTVVVLCGFSKSLPFAPGPFKKKILTKITQKLGFQWSFESVIQLPERPGDIGLFGDGFFFFCVVCFFFLSWGGGGETLFSVAVYREPGAASRTRLAHENG